MNKLTNCVVSTEVLWNVTLSLGEDRGAVIFKGQQSKKSFDIKATRNFETSGMTHPTTHRHIWLELPPHRCENPNLNLVTSRYKTKRSMKQAKFCNTPDTPTVNTTIYIWDMKLRSGTDIRATCSTQHSIWCATLRTVRCLRLRNNSTTVQLFQLPRPCVPHVTANILHCKKQPDPIV